MPRLVLLTIAILLAGCNAQPAPVEDPPLAGAAIGGDFTLTDQNGQPRTWSEFRGKYAVVYFGYTYCPDVCPTDVQRASQGLRKFAKDSPAEAAKIRQIFVTVDPERDTPAVIGEFANAFNPDMVALTGTPEQVAAAARAFKVYYGKGKVEKGGAYLVDHSNVTYLFDPSGEPMATLPTDLGADAVAQELGKWVR